MKIDKSLFISGVNEKYPEELLEKRVEIEGNVIAAIYSDCLILDEIDLDKDMFLSKDGRFYFSLANDLRKKGFNVLDEVTILSNSSDKVIDVFNEKGGYETISHLVDIINMSNFDIYMDQLYRENMLCHMYEDGFDLFKEKVIKGKKIVPIKLFRKMTCEQVIDYFESRLSSYEVGQSSSVLEEEEVDFDDTWIQNLKDGIENGIQFDRSFEDINGDPINCFPFLSRNISGILEKTTTMIGGFSSSGKSTWWITVLMALMYYDRKILIITNEENVSKFKTKLMVWLLAKRNRFYKLTKKKLMAGDIDKESMNQVNIVRKFWRDSGYNKRFKVISIADSNISIVSKKIREHVLKYGYDTILLDTFKIQAGDIAEARQDLALVRDSRILDQLAKKYNLIMLCSVQLAEHMKGRLWLDASCLSNSKQVKEQLENLFLLRNVYDEELDEKSKYYLRPYKLVKHGDKWIEEEYRCDRTKTWKILFVEKCRSGANSSDTNTAYLLAFDGDHAVFRESCMCRPRHGNIQ